MEILLDLYHPTDDPDFIRLLRARRPSTVPASAGAEDVNYKTRAEGRETGREKPVML